MDDISNRIVVMPYIGKALSENYYKIIGRGGVHTSKTRPETIIWMKELTEKVRGFYPNNTPMTIYLTGRFVDERCPDLSNLHKVLADAIKVGIGLDDKHFVFVDRGYTTGHIKPELEIELE